MTARKSFIIEIRERAKKKHVPVPLEGLGAVMPEPESDYMFGEQDDTRYREGIYVGYRYFDSIGKKPLFPFGFGLGYTDFTADILSADEKNVTVNVKNTGNYPGRETVQLYISCPSGTLYQPPRKLAAFAKTKELKPGEEQTLIISYDLRDVSSYDEKSSAYLLESGDYTVLVGETPAVTLRLDETAVVKKVRSSLGTPDFKDWQHVPSARVSAAEKIKVISARSFETENINYDMESDIDPVIDKMTDEELALMNVGYFNPKGGMASMIGSAAAAVAGAAGETAHVKELPLSGKTPLCKRNGY